MVTSALTGMGGYVDIWKRCLLNVLFVFVIFILGYYFKNIWLITFGFLLYAVIDLLISYIALEKFKLCPENRIEYYRNTIINENT